MTTRLMLGDCLQLLPALPADSVDAVVTSPPYNTLASITDSPSGMWANSHGGLGFVRALAENGYHDDMEETEYQNWQRRIFQACSRLCKDSGSLFYNHQMRWRGGELLHPVQWFRPEGWRLRQEIVWDKAGGMMMNARMFCRFDERILWFIKGKHKWNQDSVGLGTIWKIARFQQQQGKEHPTAFPLEIPLRCIQASTEEGDTVLDPFMGSGTTGVACVQTGRNFIGMEIDETYFNIAKKRIAQAEADVAAEAKFFGQEAAQ